MARSFARASSQYLAASSSPVSGLPLTLATWVRRTSDVADGQVHYIASLSKAGDAGENVELRITANEALELTSVDASTTIFAANATAITINQWYHAAVVFASSTSKILYQNGGNVASVTTASSPAGLDLVSIGCSYRNASAANFFDGGIACTAIWNVALSANEVARLYNNGIGADPRSVRPDALVAYWPLINGDGDQDYWGNYHLTASGSPTYAQHPPVLMRSRPKSVILGSAAPTVGEVTITGTRTIGETITANATPTPGDATLTYQWEKSATGSGSGTDISGETASTLALTYADFGDILDTAAYVRCGVVATKDAVPSVETFSSWLEVSAGGAASVGSPFVSSSIR